MDVLEVEVNHFALERSHDLFEDLELLLSASAVGRQTCPKPRNSKIDDWIIGVVQERLVTRRFSLTARLTVLDEMAMEDINILS
jgi:hypothetical protein